MNAREDRHWVDAKVRETVEGFGGWVTVATVRQYLDEEGRRLAGACATSVPLAKPATRLFFVEFQGKAMRTRTQLVRRSLHRLKKSGDLLGSIGPGEMGDEVARYRIATLETVKEISATQQLTDLRLQMAQDEMKHETRLLELRQHLAALCPHTTKRVDCLACSGFEAAGGNFESKTADVAALVDQIAKDGEL